MSELTRSMEAYFESLSTRIRYASVQDKFGRVSYRITHNYKIKRIELLDPEHTFSYTISFDLSKHAITLSRTMSDCTHVLITSGYEEGMKNNHSGIKELIDEVLKDILSGAASGTSSRSFKPKTKIGRYGLAVKGKYDSAVWFSSRETAQEALDAHNKLANDMLFVPVPHMYPAYLKTLELVREETEETVVVKVVKD